MMQGEVQYGIDRFSDRKGGHLDRPSIPIISRNTTRGIVMKQIPLTQGKFAIVDDEDYEYLMRWTWCTFERKYNGMSYGFTAIRHCRCPFRPNKSHTVFMHRCIVGTPRGMDTDHVNGDGLDNRKCNLRICTHAENMRNCKSNYGSSQFKGVYWDKKNKKWRAQITKNYVLHNLPRFQLEIEAANAYDVKAKELFGEFARLNFPERNVRNENHSCRRKRYNTTAGKP